MKQHLLIASVIILIAALLRIVPHVPNITPLAAMALFGGSYLDKRFALALPLLALFLSDLILGFHDTMFFVYGSFLLSGVIGYLLRKHRRLPYLLAGTLFSSLLFYVITNFGVWLVGSMYQKTFAGLFEAYYLALPFFRNTLLGDVVYMTAFVSLYSLGIALVTNKKFHGGVV